MARTRGKIRALLPALLVVAAATLPYLPALTSPFLFDDYNTIVQNPGLERATLAGILTDPTLISAKPGNWPWRPLLLAANVARFRLFGLRPEGWHLSAILLHALNSVLVMLAARRVFLLTRAAPAASILFALAPLSAQTALYLSAGSMALALPLALGAVLRGAGPAGDTGRPLVAAQVAALTFAAMLASEGALVTALWIALGLFARGLPLASRRAALPVAAAALGGAAYYVFRALLSAPTGGELLSYWTDRFDWTSHALIQLRAPFALGRYFLWPTGSSFFHGAAQTTPGLVVLTGLALAAAAAGIYVLRGRRACAAGLAWYFGSLLPAVLVPLNIAYSEHRACLASVGLCVAAAGLVERLLAAWDSRPALRRAGRASLAAIVALLAAAAMGRALEYRSAAAVFADAVRQSPGYFAVWGLLGAEAQARGDCRRALPWLARATSLAPDFADGYNTRAACLLRLARPAEAYAEAARAMELDPGNATYLNSAAVALMALGRNAEAAELLDRALTLARPDDPNRPVMERNRERLRRQNGR